MDIFATAANRKYRFPSSKGNVTVEDLFDMDKYELDSIFQTLDAQVTEMSGPSLLSQNTGVDINLHNKIEIVRYIVTKKLKDEEVASKAAETRALKQKILAAMSKKEDQALEGASVTELQAMLDKL